MEDVVGRGAPVFACFTYDEVGAFKHEALNTVHGHHRGWKMARGTVPVANILVTLDSFPMLDSQYD